jgi:hypothetical protein
VLKGRGRGRDRGRIKVHSRSEGGCARTEKMELTNAPSTACEIVRSMNMDISYLLRSFLRVLLRYLVLSNCYFSPPHSLSHSAFRLFIQ